MTGAPYKKMFQDLNNWIVINTNRRKFRNGKIYTQKNISCKKVEKALHDIKKKYDYEKYCDIKSGDRLAANDDGTVWKWSPF